MNPLELVSLAINTPPVEWSAVADRWREKKPGIGYLPSVAKRGTMDDAIRALASIIERLTRFHGYLDMRYGHGCGDQGHADAVKESNRQAAAVRKALGFTYSKQEVRF